ncbi:MAG: PqqD family protein [Terracidiphilus sp.]|jgi:hypothetical protein
MRDSSNLLRTVTNQDGAAILDVPRHQITTLNSTGGFIWQRLQQGLSVEQVIRDLATETDTDPATVEKDVHSFLEQLRSKQLL